MMPSKLLLLIQILTTAKASRNAAFDTAVVRLVCFFIHVSVVLEAHFIFFTKYPQVYFETARELLGWKNAWGKVDSELLIVLYCKEAQARFVIGDLTTMEILVEEILSKGLPMKDMFEAYELTILAAQAANRFDEAISVALDVRKQLGFKSIPTKVRFLTQFFFFHNQLRANLTKS